jgi:SAM-dependent methyltransferase
MGWSERKQRLALWDYYDRRVIEGVRGIGHAQAYWSGLGVAVEAEEIADEAAQVERLLRELDVATFVDVGCGPGTFTSMMSGLGVAVDQSHSALRFLRSEVLRIPAVRADALALPLRNKAVVRFFASHLYGLLQPEEARAFLLEARRVADELIILDAGRPPGVSAEGWQVRTLPDGGVYRVYRRHFAPGVLAGEVGGEVLFAGRFYVMTRGKA